MTKTQQSNVLTYVIAAASSLFFCSKGVFVKSAYAHDVDAITVLALRMGMAMPFFLVIAWHTSKAAKPLTQKQWIQLAGLGFVGYYLSSVVNFHGLYYISVGLERIVLFSYPSLVVIGGALFFKRPVTAKTLGFVALAYSGIVIAFFGEATIKGSAFETALGMGLIFISALTYALFVSVSGVIIKEIGALRFVSIVVGFSCLYIIAHYCFTHNLADLVVHADPVYFYSGILAIFGTVIPSFLMGLGLQRAGAPQFAVIGTIGPIGTLVLAHWILDESMGVAQVIGFFLSLLGGLLMSLSKSSASPG